MSHVAYKTVYEVIKNIVIQFILNSITFIINY